MTAAKVILHNEYFKTIVAVVLVVVVVFGLFFGLRAALNTPDPALTVVSGSMSIPYDAADYNFWLTLSTPFDRTLSVGDIVIVQGVNPKDLNTNYPNSDIIVFHEPGDYNTLIVHRIVSAKTVDGTLYFITKGDGNGNNNPWPETPTSGFDTWDGNNPPGVPANDVVGKVIMRIPWFGWVTIFVHDNQWGLPVIILLILVISIVEFVLPMLREKKPQQDNQNQPPPQNPPNPSTTFPSFSRISKTSYYPIFSTFPNRKHIQAPNQRKQPKTSPDSRGDLPMEPTSFLQPRTTTKMEANQKSQRRLILEMKTKQRRKRIWWGMFNVFFSVL